MNKDGFRYFILLLIYQLWPHGTKYKSEVLGLYVILFFSCHFLLPLRHISEANIVTITTLVTLSIFCQYF